jgi:hypothetical protein
MDLVSDCLPGAYGGPPNEVAVRTMVLCWPNRCARGVETSSAALGESMLRAQEGSMIAATVRTEQQRGAVEGSPRVWPLASLG